jgi:hypothetical protein
MAVCWESCGTVVKSIPKRQFQLLRVVFTSYRNVSNLLAGVRTGTERSPAVLALAIHVPTNGPVVRPRLSWSHRRCLRACTDLRCLYKERIKAEFSPVLSI